MSKLLDKLERISRGSPAPLGFSAAARREELPPMACVGILREAQAQGAAPLAQGSVDAVLVAGDEDFQRLQAVVQALGEVPWGLWVSSAEPGATAAYTEKGCDFLVFGPERAQVEALEEGDTAYFLAIPPELDDRFLRSIEDLPVDGVFLTKGSLESPLTLHHLMVIGAIRTMFGKHLLVEVPAESTARELERLRDLGVDGIAVEVGYLSPRSLEQLRDRLMAIPRQRKARSERAALLPSSAYSRATRPPRREEEEEEEEGF